MRETDTVELSEVANSTRFARHFGETAKGRGTVRRNVPQRCSFAWPVGSQFCIGARRRGQVPGVRIEVL